MTEWMELNKRVCHAECPQLGRVPVRRITICMRARMCCCDMPLLQLFVDALVASLKGAIKPRTPLRALLDQGMLIIRLSNRADRDIRLHPSYTNLSSWEFGLVPLKTDCDEARTAYASRAGLLALVASDEIGFGTQSWCQACLGVDVQQPHCIFFEQLSARSVNPPFEFLPGHVLALDVPGVAALEFWGGPPCNTPIENVARARRPTGLAPLPAPPRAVAEPLPLSVEDQQDEEDFPDPFPECGRRLDVVESLGWCNDGDTSASDTSVSDDDAWGAPVTPQADPGPQPSSPHPPAPVAPADLPPAGAVPGPHEGGPPPPAPLADARVRGEVRGIWRRVYFPDVDGYIEFEETKKKINAHCTNPAHGGGRSCKMDRLGTKAKKKTHRGQGRPAALAYCWLRDARNHIGPTAKKDHDLAKAAIGSAAYFPMRAAARCELMDMAVEHNIVKELLETEREPFSDEEEEPEVVP